MKLQNYTVPCLLWKLSVLFVLLLSGSFSASVSLLFGQTEEGCILVYYGSQSGPGSTADAVIESDLEYGWLGRRVAAAGDLNGDGYEDVVAVAQSLAGDANGKLYAFYGSPSGLSRTPDWVFQETQSSYHGPIGYPAGDVNGDGYSDIIIQDTVQEAAYTANYESYAICYGSPSGLSSETTFLFRSVDEEIDYDNITAAGDFNSDGYGDIVAGAQTDWFKDLILDLAEYRKYSISVYYGSPSGLSGDDADWAVVYEKEDVGSSVLTITAGDVDNDGGSEILIGLPQFDPSGRVLLYSGATGPEDPPDWSIEMADRNLCSFGASVSTAGDVNGDGFSDVVILADRYDYGSDEEDRVFIYYGSPIGLSTTEDWILPGTRFDAVSQVGDVNGDGCSDVAVLAYDSNYEYYEQTGNIFIYYGAAAGPGGTPGSILSFGGDSEYPQFSGYTAGDVNGDGYSDIIVGYPKYGNGGSDADNESGGDGGGGGCFISSLLCSTCRLSR